MLGRPKLSSSNLTSSFFYLHLCFCTGYTEPVFKTRKSDSVVDYFISKFKTQFSKISKINELEATLFVVSCLQYVSAFIKICETNTFHFEYSTLQDIKSTLEMTP